MDSFVEVNAITCDWRPLSLRETTARMQEVEHCREQMPRDRVRVFLSVVLALNVTLTPTLSLRERGLIQSQ